MGRPRKDGQPTQHGNRYTAGVVGRERVDRVVAFKPKITIADALFADMEEKGLTATQWMDWAVEQVLRLSEDDFVQNEGQRDELRELSPVLKDAIGIAIAQKEAALRAEKKKKPNQQDQAQIARWESQIEELEAVLEGV